MAKLFVDAAVLLHDLLDRSERGVASPVAYPDRGAFSDVTAKDSFERRLHLAEAAGAVALVRGRGRWRDELKLVRLADADALARHLGREQSTNVAERTHRDMVEGLELHQALREACLSAAASWSKGRSWHGVSAGNAPSMRVALRLAQAVVEDKHVGLDYRTFSKRVAGHSKSLEESEALVLRLLRMIVDLPADIPPRAALALLGVERFGPPLLIAGAFQVGGGDIGGGLPYVGIPPETAAQINFKRPPEYVLTIENFASFNRHVLEADPGRSGLTLYVGGYPSRSTQAALTSLGSALPPEVPFFHWSDIDVDGTWIFRTIERAVHRPLLPHLMSRELAECHGVTGKPSGRLEIGIAAGSGISDLVDYLAGSSHRTLEQEEIDPVLPQAPC